ncbi:hypothetical protein B6I21_04335 [candidate division KSB1 bacterium 4572_119]|nr:MAG: hypothetical protein B6I21_04335 [candidate division KSB1 bacterium 4572_119]
MINQVHQHILDELQQSARTDTIFVVTAVLFNLIVLAVNSAVAGSAISKNPNPSDDFVLIIFMGIMVNSVAITALLTGRSTREKLLDGLIVMYQDNEVDKYYDSSLLSNYGKRYLSFSIVILSLALTSIAVPLVIRLS